MSPVSIEKARSEFEACWARFTTPGSSRGEPNGDDLKALERAVVVWFVAVTGLNTSREDFNEALRETAEAREIIRRGKLDVAISGVRSG